MALWLLLAWLVISFTCTRGIITLPLPDSLAETDFLSFYAAGSLANSDNPAAAYSLQEHYFAELLLGTKRLHNWFFYPPTALLLYAPLARLPYVSAWFVFQGATLAGYLLVLWRILGGSKQFALGLLLALPSTFWAVTDGSNALLTTSLLGTAMLLLDRRPVMSGLLLGALVYKPHFALLAPVALIAGWHWRAFAVAGGTAAALILASVLLYGINTWQAFVAVIPSAQELYSQHMPPSMFINAFGAVLLLGGAPSVAYAAQAGATVAAAAVVALVWYRGSSLPLRAAILLAGAVVASFKCDYYEVTTVALAAAWLLTVDLRWRRFVLLGLFALTVNVVAPAMALRVPTGLIVTLGTLMLAVSVALPVSLFPRRAGLANGLVVTQ